MFSGCNCNNKGLGFLPAAATAYAFADKIGITDKIGEAIGSLFGGGKVAGACRGTPSTAVLIRTWDTMTPDRRARHVQLWQTANPGKPFPTEPAAWAKSSLGGDDCEATSPEGQQLLQDFIEIVQLFGNTTIIPDSRSGVIPDAVRAGADAARESVLRRVATSEPVIDARNQYAIEKSRDVLYTVAPVLALTTVAAVGYALANSGRRRRR